MTETATRKSTSRLLRVAGLLAFLGLTFGCVAARPPVPVQEAIRTIDRHLPAYVAEANKALAASDHPDKERLVGLGERLARAVEALDRWARGESPEGRHDPKATGKP